MKRGDQEGVPSHISTLGNLLAYRAQTAGEQHAYSYLEDGETETEKITYGSLHHKARSIAYTLKSHGMCNARALLLYPTGIDYIAAFFGCQYANTVAVPAYPPDPARLHRTLPRLLKIIDDAQVKVVLTTSSMIAMAEFLFEQAPQLKTLQWVATDVPLPAPLDWSMRAVAASDLSFIQYTSGSTGTPKGVMVSHHNVMSNLAHYNERLHHRCDSPNLGVIWLPMYHDMGLVGGILEPLFAGFPCMMMSPITFLQRPLRWLQAISKYKATYSGGPNFAFDLCVQKIKAEERQTLDLSSLRTLCNGAEPIRARTISRFSDAFAPCGFRADAFMACYGMAEAVLFISSSRPGIIPRTLSLESSALMNHQAVVSDAENAYVITSCGTTSSQQELIVVNPDTFTPCGPREIGEVWASGPNISDGYWNRPEDTQAAFGATLADETETFLRTGDLGFIDEGELFITGRLKDLIIIRGKNHYPQDIEHTVEASHPAIRSGCSAAFSVEDNDSERLVVVCEIDTHSNPDLDAVGSLIRERIYSVHELQARHICLLQKGAIPKTSSGKIQRRASKAAFLDGTLDRVSAWKHKHTEMVEEPTMKSNVMLQDVNSIEAWLKRELADRLGMSADLIDTRTPFSNLGLDSLEAVTLASELEAQLGQELSPTLFWDFPDIESLARDLSSMRASLTSLVSQPASSKSNSSPITKDKLSQSTFYQVRNKEEDAVHTNQMYMQPARFFELMIGARWQVYSGKLWTGIENADPADIHYQAFAEEQMLDLFGAMLGLRPGMTLLDIGAGWGGELIYLCKKYGVTGHGLMLSSNQYEHAVQWAKREGADCSFEICHWEDFQSPFLFDAMMTNEVVVHIARLGDFLKKAFSLLADGGAMVNKELHFTHPAFGQKINTSLSFANELYGATGNYRSLADELSLSTDAGFTIDDIKQIHPRHYYLTVAGWMANLRRHREEIIGLVGERFYKDFSTYLSLMLVDFGDKATSHQQKQLHLIKCVKLPKSERQPYQLGVDTHV